MKKIILYKGYQSADAFACFKKAFLKDDLVVFLPPTMTDYSFVKNLPRGEVVIVGELWEMNPVFPLTTGKTAYPENPVCGVFTSGTTGVSKLVLYSKKNIEVSIRGIFDLFNRERIDRICCYPQPFHTFGVTLGYGASLLLDVPLLASAGQYSTTSHEFWFENLSPGYLTLGTPTHFYDLLQWQENHEKIPSPSYSCIIGGAKVRKQLWLDLKSKLNIEKPSIGYGATEASPGITHLNPGVPPLEDGEIGRPLKHVAVRITDEGLTFSGPNLCLGTIENSRLDFPQECLLPDVVQIRGDGHWVYKTRSNWFLNRGGEKFSLEKFEQDIFAQTGVETLCVAIPDERLGEELGVLIKSDSAEFEVKKANVFACLKKSTLRDFSKDFCYFQMDFPLNENLKFDRRKAGDFLRQSKYK